MTNFAANSNPPELRCSIYPLHPIFRSMRSTLMIPLSLLITASSACIPANRTAFQKRNVTSGSAGVWEYRRWVKFNRQEKLKPVTWCGSIPALC